MTLIVRNLEKRFGERLLFSGVSFTVGPGRKVALIGANGSGKTTLMNMIAGREEIDAGSIEMPVRNYRIGIMEQFYSFDEKGTLLDDALSAAEEINRLSIVMSDAVEKLSSENDPEIIKRLSTDYADAEGRFLVLGGYNFEGEVRKLLKGIGFREEDFDKKVSDLSGGERSRLALGKLLIAKPNLLLLDEPTNHLDIESVEWLEEFMREYQGGVFMVSHDRYFVDNVAQVILELEDGTISSYTGNYRDYLKLKCEKVEREWKEFKRQQDEMERLRRFINRWRADKRRASQAKSREKILSKMEPVKAPKRGQKQFSIHIESGMQSFTKVLEVENACKSYAGKNLFHDLNFEVIKGENFAIVGRNGEGKSTLIRCLMSRDDFDSGHFQWGGNTVIGHFAQDRIELDPRQNFLEAFLEHFPDWTPDQGKQFLGRFYINLEYMYKNVADISGGEKSKLAIAILIAQKPNVLVLDEPTNHLDIIATEALEMALESYDGSLILVSHDRRLLDRLANRTLYLKDGRGEIFLGNYSYMKEKLDERARREIMKQEKTVKEQVPRTEKPRKINVYKRQQIENLYGKITDIEDEIEKKHGMMADPSVAKDWEKVAKLKEEIDMLNEQISRIQDEIERREKDLYSQG